MGIDLRGEIGCVRGVLSWMGGLAPTIGNRENLTARVVRLGTRVPRGICVRLIALLPRSDKKRKDENQRGNGKYRSISSHRWPSR